MAIESRHARKIQNATPKERKKFLEVVHSHYQQQNLYERLQNLRELEPKDWNQEMLQEYERCDKQHINGMLAAEQKTSKVKRLTKARCRNLKKGFLEDRIVTKMTHTRPSNEYIKWSENLGIVDFKAIDVLTIKRKLRESQKKCGKLRNRRTTYARNIYEH
jgi:hypothetical protein